MTIDKLMHMSITQQEAFFLQEILDRHLDDFVEEMTKEKFKSPEADQTKAWGYYQRNRQAALDLKAKAKEVITRANLTSGTGTRHTVHGVV